MTESIAELRVGAHVLVQLGSELVTDAEQAILECVKNAYDADSPTCRIEIDTRERASRTETGTAARLARFIEDTDTVLATIEGVDGQPLSSEPGPDTPVVRRLDYEGRITVEDAGTGIASADLANSWLVVSGSGKRADGGGPKARTALGRTPLGDKGLGRLGSMKLGDILLVETAIAPDAEIASAQFRWRDCDTADTIDQIPVALGSRPNIDGFKGTRVSVLGLRDLAEWRRDRRLAEITASLARLISPFEATSTFPVTVELDGRENTLGMVTDELLSRAVARFDFNWGPAFEGGPNVLHATARLRKRLLAPMRSDRQRTRTAAVFEADGGAAFAETLRASPRLRKRYDDLSIDPDGAWFAELDRTDAHDDTLAADAAVAADPGPFRGAFYFFHLVGDDDDADGTASGSGVTPSLVKSMAGVAILRDGFQVRSRGDWLELSSGMTSGSTYNMRVDNTVGYFVLSGSENHRLVEKSDREGFVEDANYRGFLRIARRCRDFANGALVDVRRSVDAFAKKLEMDRLPPPEQTFEGALSTVGRRLKTVVAMRAGLGAATVRLTKELDDLGAPGADPSRAAAVVREALRSIDEAGAALTEATPDSDLLKRLQLEVEEGRAQAERLVESAAVGLAARGLTHELRTHLGEIRQRVTRLERSAGGGTAAKQHLVAIKRSCAALQQAASLVDPLMQRSRAVKDRFGLVEFVQTYLEQRDGTLARWGATAAVQGPDTSVRMNRARLLQVVDNLVRNSLFWMRRSTPEGKRMITVQTTPGGFILEDTGPGVDPRVEESLFDLFVTTKHQEEEGQGLGLFIVNQLLAIDGCSIALSPDRNEEGRRYRFTVDLSAVTTGI
ncbi:hypothetical protein ASG29_06515 [Sphingomonas sp. Leaf412]|uniref:sensor histidine kinase n=1 Tax=Sphingomonas sp. Leaf412 TaxID=1736370 RepID=UPI0006F210FF|nr:sensor histidine kinase [Sphingomonas sp. Leaf412]KQT33659.1 hypothetical protein ASG29_06515 [Sphingomonas sp. Leaf412]